MKLLLGPADNPLSHPRYRTGSFATAILPELRFSALKVAGSIERTDLAEACVRFRMGSVRCLSNTVIRLGIQLRRLFFEVHLLFGDAVA
jgi:hypothetical protein